ncbi:hypothetical protein P4607_22970 [Priestia megaterium]|uniref:DUF6941 family protein n=1 Tax=Priestia megaterium TaxID=1404 RepID=UPI002E1F0368|nr:hypothetical protein [Priestia megaterium]
MPRISTFMYCESTQFIGQPNSNNQKLTIENPLHVFAPPFIPGTFSFGIVFGLLGIDPSEEHALRLVFSYSKGTDPVIDTGSVNIPKQLENNVPVETNGFMMNMDFRNVIFREEGSYETQLFLNGEILGTFPIIVKRGESN